MRRMQAEHDRDENAAKNIRRRGLEKLKSPGGTGTVGDARERAADVHVQGRDNKDPAAP